MLPHPTATSVLGTALHVILRNALRTAALPILAIPGGAATFRSPAFRRVWWLALGWSLAEVAAGVAQGYETLALYRDVLVPESHARELVASALAPSTWPLPPARPQNGGGSENSASPPRAADERLRESLSRGEDGGGGPCAEVAGSPPVRGRQLQSASRSAWTAASDAEIRLEVDKDFDELVAVKAREELEELYGFPAIVSWSSTIVRSSFSVADGPTFLGGNAARARVCVVLVARRVDIALARHRPAPLCGLHHIALCLVSNRRK